MFYCAPFEDLLLESTGLRYYPYISSASELGERESSTLNIASLLEGGKGRNQINPVAHRAESSMSKAILPEPNLPGAST
jgi:hypothetical protein